MVTKMKINILTLFPEMFNPITEDSMLGKAVQNKILDIDVINIRDYSKDKHNKADDYPFGGGGGMVMMPQPIMDCIEEVKPQGKMIYMSPRGKVLNKEKVLELSKEKEITLLCGHYEGVDQRVLDKFNMEEISIGDYIVTGGELPAMVLVDAIARFIPGVLGSEESAYQESIYTGLLEHDQYTQPREFDKMQVPEVLFSGNHQEIDLWRYANSLEKTKTNRPDILKKYIEEINKKREENPKDSSLDKKHYEIFENITKNTK